MKKQYADPDKEDTSCHRECKTHTRKWGLATECIDTEDKNNEFMQLKTAEVEISLLDERGIIKSVRIIDGGSGYSQANVPIGARCRS